jgi:integrase
MPPSTPDNQITKADGSGAITEAQSELVALDARAEEEVDKAVPANTRRAYEFELACFVSWCARHGVRAVPAEPRVLRAYLQELAERGRSKTDVPKGRPKGPLGYSALMRALAAICRSHQQAGHLSPWKDPVIEGVRDKFARALGKAPKKQKHAIEAVGEGLLFRVCDLISDDVRGVRDRAMLLVGWSGGGRRRSEITAARAEDFTEIAEGIRWSIPRSKADQIGKGLVVLMKPSDDERYCPVQALRRWLEVSKIESGPVFRGVEVGTNKIMDVGLAPEGVSRRVQCYVKLLGLDPADFGGHSLRSGFVTTAHRLGENAADIAASTGHHGVNQVNEYIRRAGLEDAAGPGLLNRAIAQRGSQTEPSKPKEVDEKGANEAMRKEKER